MKNALYSLGGNISFAILGFASIAIVSRSLSVLDFGIWVIYITSSSLFDMLRLGFIQTGLVRFISGKTNDEAKAYIAASWMLGISLTCMIGIVLYCFLFIVPKNSSFYPFFLYYPILSIATLPQLFTQAIAQANFQMRLQMSVKFSVLMLSMVLFISSFFYNYSIDEFILYHAYINAFVSLFYLMLGKGHIQSIVHFRKKELIELIHFGKYSIGTLIGTNLLKSTDTFMLALFLGAENAAMYSIPLKLTEAFEIILRSVINVSIPLFSSLANANQYVKLNALFHTQTGLLILLYIPLMLCCFFSASWLLALLGGEKYASLQMVFQILCIYGLLLPLDRFTGVTLDCINLPNKNLYKVLLMVLTNATLDFLILSTTDRLEFIAVGTILTSLTGIFFGVLFLKPKVNFKLKIALHSGKEFWNMQLKTRFL